MKNFFSNLLDIEVKIKRAGGIFLLLDFDGVISTIAPKPEDAFLSKKNRELLQKLSEQFPISIITGRTLKNIKNKADIKNVLYIGNHGLEWEEGGKVHTKPVPKTISTAINLARKKIKPMTKSYTGMIFEDKGNIITAHYRVMNPNIIGKFKKEIFSILKPLTKVHNLRLDHHKKTIELRPEIDWDKGDSVLFACNYFRNKTENKFVPVYIGDSDTDEDAFKALKDGITIRVGKRKGSSAKYYFSKRSEVDLFLKWMLNLIPSKEK